MEAIHDAEGAVVGWRHRTALFHPAGEPRAFISRRGVFTYEGRYLGRFEDGWYRDQQGYVVAFEEGASGGPLRPQIRPAIVPKHEPDPPPPPVEVPPPPRMRPPKWSALTWQEYLDGA